MTDRNLTSETKSAPPHRLLFLHGLFRKSYPHSGRTVAELMAKGLDRAEVSAAPDLLLDDGGRCPRYLVQPSSDDAAWPTIEVVEVVYDDIIKARDDQKPLIQRALAGLWVLRELPRLWRLRKPGHPRITRPQAAMALLMALIFVIAVAVTVLLVFSIVYGAIGYLGTIVEWICGWLGSPTVEPAPPATDQTSRTGPGHLAGSIAILAFCAILAKLLVHKSFSESQEDATSAMFAVIDYQKPGSALRHTLLERVRSALHASAGIDHAHSISILAFSQGSLLAIDALFPAQTISGLEPAPAPRVDLLVTLGCPLAVVTRLWPERPTRPTAQHADVRRWINFYEANDKLGGKLADLVMAENITTDVEDREFSYTEPSGRPAKLPHFAYWLDGPRGERPSATQIAAEVVNAGQQR